MPHIKLGGLLLRHDKIAIVYLEEDNALILLECQLRKQLFVQVF